MAKKNKNKFNLQGVDILQLVTDRSGKKGKFHGTKKEKKVLKWICPHTKYKKKGKKAPFIVNEGGKNCRCLLCNQRFKADFLSEGEVKKRVDSVQEVTTQAAFMNQTINGGADTTRFLAETSLHLMNLGKTYKKLASICEKKDSIRKKKKKNKNSYGSNLGGWGTRY